MSSNLEAHHQYPQMNVGLVMQNVSNLMNVMTSTCLEIGQCTPWWSKIQCGNQNECHPLWH